MNAMFARIVVLVSGAAILVVETLATRLVAPYVGLTLESTTAVIGVALAGIAAGAALGGRWADEFDPRRVVTGALLVGGLGVLAVRPLVRLVGPVLGPGPAAAVLLVAASTLVPVTALAMVTPGGHPVPAVRCGRLRDGRRAAVGGGHRRLPARHVRHRVRAGRAAAGDGDPAGHRGRLPAARAAHRHRAHPRGARRRHPGRGAARRGADRDAGPLRRGHRLLLRARRDRSGPGRRPHPGARRPAALRGGPGRPGAAAVRLHPADGRRGRHRVPARAPAERGAPGRRRLHHAALAGRHPSGQRLDGARGRPRGGRAGPARAGRGRHPRAGRAHRRRPDRAGGGAHRRGRPGGRGRVRRPLGALAPGHRGVRGRGAPGAAPGRDLPAERDRLRPAAAARGRDGHAGRPVPARPA